MTVLSPLRQEIRGIIGVPCMVQRDRAGRALFYSDFPLRAAAAEEALCAAGFTVRLKGAYRLIDLSRERYHALYAALPALPLPPMTQDNALMIASCDMLRRHQSPLASQPLNCLREALMLVDSGQHQQLALRMQAWLADALRDHLPAPSATAELLLNHLS